MQRLDVFYLPLAQGDRFCLLHVPAPGTPARGAMLFVHPFAEEMNNCRHMAALQARAFADAGWTVLQADLYGCGDSAGEFGDATWQRWIDDVIDAAAWLRAKTGHAPVLWGMRAGCLLCVQAASRMPSVPDLVLWQPVGSGKHFLQQFLRLKVAHQIVAPTNEARIGTQELRAQLARGETIEVAGYILAPALALPMQSAELELPANSARVAWLELSGADPSELSPASRLRIQRWMDQGHRVEASAVKGPPFWQNPGIGDCPALVERTLAAVELWR